MAAYLYLNWLGNWERPSHPIGGWQKASFFTGLFLIFIALQSPLDNLSNHLLSFHQLQHFLLRMMAPLLVLLGAQLGYYASQPELAAALARPVAWIMTAVLVVLMAAAMWVKDRRWNIAILAVLILRYIVIYLL